MEGHTPSWPHSALAMARHRRQGSGRDRSASLQNVNLVIDLEGHAPSWPRALR